MLVPEYCLSFKPVSQRSSATAGNMKFARDIKLFGECNAIINNTESFSKSAYSITTVQFTYTTIEINNIK